MPRDPPVTSAIRPSSENKFFIVASKAPVYTGWSGRGARSAPLLAERDGRAAFV
jgi:hypothetical protein